VQDELLGVLESLPARGLVDRVANLVMGSEFVLETGCAAGD
jgi:hypothetical protein